MRRKTYLRKLRQAKRYNIEPSEWLNTSKTKRKLIMKKNQRIKQIVKENREQVLWDISILYENELL
jgi:hypothetical protein